MTWVAAGLLKAAETGQWQIRAAVNGSCGHVKQMGKVNLGVNVFSFCAELAGVAVLAEKVWLSILSLKRTRGSCETLRLSTILQWRRCR